MGPEQVRVGVDHLRLDPEAELHPPVADVADQRAEPVRPDVSSTYQSPSPAVSSRRCRNQPSSSTNRSTPAAAARSASSHQPVEVVVEVHRLPDVERRRPGAARVPRPGPQPAVEGGRDPVQPGPAVRGAQLRRRVLLPRREDDLAGQQQLAAAEPGRRRGGRARRSVTELPLQATCTAQTSPDRKPKPGVPAHRPTVASWPVRPARFSRTQLPIASGCRCGLRSRHQCPVKSSSSPRPVRRSGGRRPARRAGTARRRCS